ncbi:MAG TPA: AsmA family protein, partial [Gammaproteobacteria bacterium]|nr:AsmA family protein [Gammaproteobacteria bacterium]
MAKLLKVLGIAVAALIGLFIVVIVLVGILFDPNDYKTEIAAAVEDSTGRTLTLDGDLELQLFPRLRIAVGEASLSNAAGFGDEPFARIGAARLQVGLLPLLLSQRLEIDEVRLAGLTLNLARNAQGTGNWEDMAAAAAGEEAGELVDDDEPAAPGDVQPLALVVQGIAIDDAEVHWSDATTGADWRLDDFNLQISNLSP